MKINTMRWVDRRAGVPLCALATALLAIWHRLRPPAQRSMQRILFIELSEMGSTILADPAMRKARAHNAEIYFAIFSQNAGALGLSVPFPMPTSSPFGILRFGT